MARSISSDKANALSQSYQLTELDKKRVQQGRNKANKVVKSGQSTESSVKNKPTKVFDPDKELTVLEDILSTIESIEATQTTAELEIGDPRAAPSVKEGCTFEYSKYIKAAEVPEVLQDLYTDMGIYEFDAFVDSFSTHECEKCGQTAFVNMRGSTNNPYMQYKSVLSSASKQTKKLQNLMADFTMLQVVPTFPKEISEKLADSDKDIDKVQERMWNCLKNFLKRFRELKTTHDRQILASASSHIWKSQRPAAGPHAHFHLDIPMLQVDYPSRSRIKEFELQNMRKLRQYHEAHEERKEKIAEVLNNRLAKFLNLDKIQWVERESGRMPVDHKNMKELWTEAVNNEFGTNYDLLNLRVEYYASHNKSKMLHALTYRSRKPVLDLAMSVIDVGPLQKLENEELMKQNKEWCKTLIEYDNRSRVFGAWNSIKQLIGYGHREEEEICRICGSGLILNGCTRQTLQMSEIDQFVQRSGKNLKIYSTKDPPPILEGQKQLHEVGLC